MEAFAIFGFCFGMFGFALGSYAASQIAGLRVLALATKTELDDLKNEVARLKAESAGA